MRVAPLAGAEAELARGLPEGELAVLDCGCHEPLLVDSHALTELLGNNKLRGPGSILTIVAAVEHIAAALELFENGGSLGEDLVVVVLCNRFGINQSLNLLGEAAELATAERSEPLDHVLQRHLKFSSSWQEIELDDTVLLEPTHDLVQIEDGSRAVYE